MHDAGAHMQIPVPTCEQPVTWGHCPCQPLELAHPYLEARCRQVLGHSQCGRASAQGRWQTLKSPKDLRILKHSWPTGITLHEAAILPLQALLCASTDNHGGLGNVRNVCTSVMEDVNLGRPQEWDAVRSHGLHPKELNHSHISTDHVQANSTSCKLGRLRLHYIAHKGAVHCCRCPAI